MPYFCTTQGCYFQKKNYSYPTPGNCQECGQPFVLQVEYDAFETDVAQNYPYVIAFPFKRMIEEADYFTKFSILKDVFVNALKYQALLVATEYFKSPLKSELLNTLFTEKLQRPYHGDWNGFLQQAIQFLEENNYSFFIKELPVCYHAIESGLKNNLPKKYPVTKEYTTPAGRLKTETKEYTAIRALLYYRNEKFAHTQTISKETAQQVYYTCYAILKDLLLGIAYCKNYPMYKADRVFYYSLMGTQVTKAGQITALLSDKDTVWIENPERERMSLLPFFVQPTQYMAGAQNMEVLMYEGNTGAGGRMIFDSPESFKPEAQGEILNLYYDLLANKQNLQLYNNTHFTRELLAQKIEQHNKRVYKELTEEFKLLKGIYQRREDAEVALLSWAGARASIFLLIAEAGVGKTNLLWNMKQQYEAKLTTTVMVLRAARFEYDSLQAQLIQLWQLEPNFNFAESTTFAFTQQNPLMLLVDGGNEHPNPTQFLQSVVQFVTQFAPGSVKVVLSWRANNEAEKPTILPEWETVFYPHLQANNHIQYHYQLLPLNQTELQGAWNDYVNHPNNRYKVDFTYSDLVLHNRPLAQQLSNPLLLKFFVTLYKGKSLKQIPASFGNIWGWWWQQQINSLPQAAQLLQFIAVLAADQQHNRIPLNSLYNHPTIGALVRNYQIDSPYQQLLRQGILTQYTINQQLYVSITLEAVWYYALCKHIIEQRGNLAFYCNKGTQWLQGVQYCLTDAALKQKKWILQTAINNPQIPISILANPIAAAFVHLPVNEVIDMVITKDAERGWKLLRESMNLLEEAQQLQLVKQIINKVAPLVSYEILDCALLVTKYLNVIDKSIADTIAPIIEKLIHEIPVNEENAVLLEHYGDYLKFIGSYDGALEYYYKVLSIRKNFYGEEHPTIATTYNNIGNILDSKGDYDGALEFYLKDLKIDIKFHGDEHPRIATSYGSIGSVLKSKGDYDGALEYYYKALAIRKKFHGDEHPTIATSYSSIGSVLKSKGDYDGALEYYNKALTIRKKFHGEEHPDIATSYNNIGLVYNNKGDYDGALEFYYKAITIWKKFHGEEHPTIATSYSSIGSVLKSKGDYDGALEYYNKALTIRKKFHGEEHPDIATSYNNIGLVYNNKGDYDGALEFYLKDLKIDIKFHGDEHPRIATSYGSIGSVLKSKGDYDGALEYYNKALTIRKKFHGEEHPDIATSYNNIGLVYNNKGDYDGALEFYYKAITIYIKFHGEEHPNIATSYSTIGTVLDSKGDYDGALEYYNKALTIRKKFHGEEHPDIATSYSTIGTVLDSKGDYDGALEYYNKALAIRKKFHGEEHPRIATSYSTIGTVLKNKGDYDGALEFHHKALAIRKKFHGEEHPTIATSYSSIGSVLKSKGDYDGALEFHHKALAIRIKYLGQEHPNVARLYNNIGVVLEKQLQFNTALEYYIKCRVIYDTTLPSNHTDFAILYRHIGDVYRAIQQPIEALTYLNKAQAIYNKQTNLKEVKLAYLYNSFGLYYEQVQQPQQAVAYFQKAYELKSILLGNENEEVKKILACIERVKNF